MSHLSQKFSESKPIAPARLATRKPRKKTPPPFSLRLTEDERVKLDTAAAGMPLGPFIKAKLFDGDLSPRRTRGQAPVKDHAALARALGLLGNLRLANNLNQLAKAANKGALPLSPEVEDELMATCAAVLAIRMELMKALGYESGDR
ncbi:plasmid mobilization relaxosome protein MobC [Rhodophyticola porphyridii]|uniref:Plasmid mobilization relaxosome protein MobC n=1 Tax=Rhodophyticola porphyridii TaxID=1852017 RepID=A0A3L9YF50_9RHOB|nr:plasmid mobilization relaxosome protein MobC [Rhodophyticola porphyridii]RMA41570.1 plasmid mobilization relaxosome protein MobC [Rhodophyticola porphyridii]